MKFGNKKGQAVMEYLITYGLALFVILIVLGILVAVVIPSLKAPEECQFTQPGFNCNQKQHVIVSGTGDEVSVMFYLGNDQGAAVNVLGVLCTTDSSGNIDKSTIDAPDQGEFQLASGAGEEVTVACIDGNDQAVVLTPNSNFRGTVAVVYERVDDMEDAPTRLAVATVAGTVQASD